MKKGGITLDLFLATLHFISNFGKSLFWLPRNKLDKQTKDRPFTGEEEALRNISSSNGSLVSFCSLVWFVVASLVPVCLLEAIGGGGVVLVMVHCGGRPHLYYLFGLLIFEGGASCATDHRYCFG